MKLQLSKKVQEKVKKSILITGAARSGTTITGKVLHSFRKIEYLFEPETLFSLLAIIDDIPKPAWKLLFETYLYEDFLMNAIAGRRINCNQYDDSSIYNVKNEYDINSRLKKSFRKNETEKIAQSKIIAYKIPDVAPYLLRVQQYYPDIKIITTKRDATETINSLLAKKWFSTNNLVSNVIWPFRMHHGKKIPYWVCPYDSDSWLAMSELDRCAYYYIRINEDLDKINNKIEICYEQLLANPLKITKHLAETLNLEFGEKTYEIIDQIKPTVKNRDPAIVEKISMTLREKVLNYSR